MVTRTTPHSTSTSERFRYPCLGRTDTAGFAAFLDAELGRSRANLHALGEELAGVFDAPHLTLVSSGSSANLVAALALAERARARRALPSPGHAVISAFTFPTTVAALRLAGFSCTFVDVAEGSWNLDPRAVEEALTPDTTLLAPTHFLGFPAPLGALRVVAQEHDLEILQDGCETMDLRCAPEVLGDPEVRGDEAAPSGTAWQQAHTLGTLTSWSFYHPHHLAAFGGGAVVATSEELRELVESITHWGRRCTCHYAPSRCRAPEGWTHQFSYDRVGVNAELSELNACFARFQLRSWDEQERRRHTHYDILHARLSEALAGSEVALHPAPRHAQTALGSPFVFPLTLPVPVRPLVTALARRGVEARSLMGGVVRDQAAFAPGAALSAGERSETITDDGLARARLLAERSCFVGIHQTLPTEDVEAVAGVLVEEISTLLGAP